MINALATAGALLERQGKDATRLRALEGQARKFDEGRQLRPNALLASRCHTRTGRAPAGVDMRPITAYVTGSALPIRSDPAYRGVHRGPRPNRTAPTLRGRLALADRPCGQAELRTSIEIPGIHDGLRADLAEMGPGIGVRDGRRGPSRSGHGLSLPSVVGGRGAAGLCRHERNGTFCRSHRAQPESKVVDGIDR